MHFEAQAVMTETTSSIAPAKILIVDDHPLMREALHLTLASEQDMSVVGEATDETQAFDLAMSLQPDLALVDISLENGNGIELVKQIRSKMPDIKILVISTYPESMYAERAIRAGAMGYINKQNSKEDVLHAMRTILSGDRYIDEEIAKRLEGQARTRKQAPNSPIDLLSNRELEVFQLLGRGLTGSAVAEQIGVSVHTVDSYRARLKTKLGLTNGTELQREAVRWVVENE